MGLISAAPSTYGDYYFTLWGLILTLIGTGLAALKTVVTNLIQTGGGGRLRLHPLDLLMRMSPLAFIQCVMYGWYTGELERVRKYGAREMTRTKALGLLINGIIAFGLNVVSFTANKKTSALTMSECREDRIGEFEGIASLIPSRLRLGLTAVAGKLAGTIYLAAPPILLTSLHYSNHLANVKQVLTCVTPLYPSMTDALLINLSRSFSSIVLAVIIFDLTVSVRPDPLYNLSLRDLLTHSSSCLHSQRTCSVSCSPSGVEPGTLSEADRCPRSRGLDWLWDSSSRPPSSIEYKEKQKKNRRQSF
jgi:hypothetical protein